MKTTAIHHHRIAMRWQKLLIGLSVLAAMSTSAFAEPSEELRQRMIALEKSLFVGGEVTFNHAKPLPEAEQRKILDAVFPTLTTVDEKLAFLRVMIPDYRPAINNLTLYGEYAAKLLKDADAEVRMNAVRGLEYNRLRQFGAGVAPLLDDPDLKVRLPVLRALGTFGRHDLAPRMIRIAQEAKTQPERTEAISAIGRMLADSTGTAAQHDAEMVFMGNYLEEKAPNELQVVALGWLAGVPDADKHLDQILKLMTQGEAKTRQAAVKVLAYIPDQSATTALLAALKDSEAGGRSHAAKSLASLDDSCGKSGKLRPPTPTAAAEIALLLEDENEWVRLAAVESLVGLNATNHIEGIAKRMDDPNVRVREEAIKAMATLKAAKFANAVATHLNDEDRGIRLTAFRTLFDIGTSEQTPAVLAKASDKDPAMQNYVLGMIQKYDLRDQRSLVEKLATDENKDTEFSAKELLDAWDKNPAAEPAPTPDARPKSPAQFAK